MKQFFITYHAIFQEYHVNILNIFVAMEIFLLGGAKVRVQYFYPNFLKYCWKLTIFLIFLKIFWNFLLGVFIVNIFSINLKYFFWKCLLRIIINLEIYLKNCGGIWCYSLNKYFKGYLLSWVGFNAVRFFYKCKNSEWVNKRISEKSIGDQKECKALLRNISQHWIKYFLHMRILKFMSSHVAMKHCDIYR